MRDLDILRENAIEEAEYQERLRTDPWFAAEVAWTNAHHGVDPQGPTVEALHAFSRTRGCQA